MSYDLNFYKRTADSITNEDVANYLNALPNVTNEQENQWIYEHEETGVYCMFEYDGESSYEDIEEEVFADFEDTHFRFNINFIRPQFFGKECFPLVDHLAEDLNLYILNPQGEAEPKKYEKGALEKEWAASNLKFAKANFEEFGLCYLPPEKSDYAWNYNNQVYARQQQYGQNYFVPTIFYIKPEDSREAFTLVVWPEHIPFLLPKVDYVFVNKKIKKFLRTKREDGLVKYDEVLKSLGSYLEDVEDYKVLSPENSAKVAEHFNALPVFSSVPDFGEPMTVDRLVNVEG